MYRQKSVIFTIGKTLYVGKGWARTKKEKCLISLYKEKPYIYRKHILSCIYKASGAKQRKREGSYIYR